MPVREPYGGNWLAFLLVFSYRRNNHLCSISKVNPGSLLLSLEISPLSMKKLTLQEATHRNLDALYKMHFEMGDEENGFTNPAFGISRDDFDQYIDELIDCSRGIGVNPEFVPQTTFWLMRGAYPIGISRLRHTLNESLRTAGGHIGYYIRPCERKKGYGHLILSLTLDRADLLSINPVLLTCDSDNTGSRRIIQNNGGLLEREDHLMQFCYYWIDRS